MLVPFESLLHGLERVFRAIPESVHLGELEPPFGDGILFQAGLVGALGVFPALEQPKGVASRKMKRAQREILVFLEGVLCKERVEFLEGSRGISRPQTSACCEKPAGALKLRGFGCSFERSGSAFPLAGTVAKDTEELPADLGELIAGREIFTAAELLGIVIEVEAAQALGKVRRGEEAGAGIHGEA
jgi:hypothetical protein